MTDAGGHDNLARVFGSDPYAVEKKGGRMRWQSGLVGRRAMLAVSLMEDFGAEMRY
jgi:hypothetical protein